VQVADDTLNADTAYRLACEGTALLWRGDFHNARQLLQALARRVDRKPRKAKAAPAAAAPAAQAFHLHRQAQAQRARVLAMVLIPLDEGYAIPLRRAPDLRQACTEAWGLSTGASVASLRELQGLVGAHEWRKKGVPIAALGASIHPHYGVFSPVRGEYLDLVAQAPLPSTELAFDIGTGTGVLAALLARRGVQRVVATDLDPRALACARDNLARLKLTDAPWTCCRPTCSRPAARRWWCATRPGCRRGLPHPSSMRCTTKAAACCADFWPAWRRTWRPGGEGWLILSDLAEHLGLRKRDELLGWIADAGLKVSGRTDMRPRHPKAADANDALHAARAAEVTSLWRLTVT
jgi:SAM-dependent methyltransferase